MMQNNDFTVLINFKYDALISICVYTVLINNMDVKCVGFFFFFFKPNVVTRCLYRFVHKCSWFFFFYKTRYNKNNMVYNILSPSMSIPSKVN
jgi:hypothetical protein